jgi:P-type Ca2+ transporter type 2B
MVESERIMIEKDFVFLAAFGLNDDLREGVAESIKEL